MGATASKTQPKTSTSLHLRDKKELAGVGVIFRKNPDGMLVVKDVVGGSSADESGLIEPGDFLTQVDDVKVAKSSIADISGMVLGTPGESVKLKFTRMVGKSKKKYKVVLKRTVRASLEPTYHVQRDGVNTKVTHIHLDCLQNMDRDQPASPAANQARDVLDANGNVVGPGLLQRSRAAGAVSVPGVERIDESHPAWPGNKKKKTPAQDTLNSPASTPKKQPQPDTIPEIMPDPLPTAKPATDAAAAGDAGSLLNDFSEQEVGGEAGDAMSFLDSFACGRAAAMNRADTQSKTTLAHIQQAPEPIGITLDEPPAAAPESVVPPMQVAAAAAEEAEEEEEEEKNSGAPDWEGLAQSRLAVFEAKAREQQPAKKKVDLEKEWARSAAAATPATPATPASAPPPPVSAAAADISHIGDIEKSHELPVEPVKHKPVRNSVGIKAHVAPLQEGPKSSPFGDKVVKASTPAAADKPKPEKMASGGKGGDLAAMMAARRKAQEESQDDGYYF